MLLPRERGWELRSARKDTRSIPGESNSWGIYLHDRLRRRTKLVVEDPAIEPSFGVALFAPAISAMGRVVAFTSSVALLPSDDNGAPDVYVSGRH